jgi:hypothetical protein
MTVLLSGTKTGEKRGRDNKTGPRDEEKVDHVRKENRATKRGTPGTHQFLVSGSVLLVAIIMNIAATGLQGFRESGAIFRFQPKT